MRPGIQEPFEVNMEVHEWKTVKTARFHSKIRFPIFVISKTVLFGKVVGFTVFCCQKERQKIVFLQKHKERKLEGNDVK
jgi:hypothetical protein